MPKTNLTSVFILSTLLKVQVNVVNSGNVDVSTWLIVGQVIPEGPPNGGTDPNPVPDSALIKDIVSGWIGNNVDIRVTIEDSANIYTKGSGTEVHIGKGTLMDEIINGANTSSGGYFKVEVENSANIYSAFDPKTSNTKVFIRDGQLDDEAVDFDAGTNSRIIVYKSKCANVQASELHIWDGELSDVSKPLSTLLLLCMFDLQFVAGSCRCG